MKLRATNERLHVYARKPHECGPVSVVGKMQDLAATAGVNLFLTGGALRDMMGGFPVRDLDFTVEGPALKLRSLPHRSSMPTDYFDRRASKIRRDGVSRRCHRGVRHGADRNAIRRRVGARRSLRRPFMRILRAAISLLTPSRLSLNCASLGLTDRSRERRRRHCAEGIASASITTRSTTILAHAPRRSASGSV